MKQQIVYKKVLTKCFMDTKYKTLTSFYSETKTQPLRLCKEKTFISRRFVTQSIPRVVSTHFYFLFWPNPSVDADK